MNEKRFALVDCNSFYASCEKIFRPDLQARPVIVLSNNDGCVIALTKEAKKLGIKRCVPFYQVEGIIKKHDVAVFSSNYELYADISRRVMNILKNYSPSVEVYSIDEAFLDLTGMNNINLTEYGREMSSVIERGVKMPVSVGIGPTKTLAKLANKIGKDRFNGVFDITGHKKINGIFKLYGIHEVWGIGFQYTKMLQKNNVFTIYDFVNLSDAWVKKNMTSRGLLTLWELRGRHCIELAESVSDKKEILSSRSFGSPVSTLKELKESVAFHVNLAAKKLRDQDSLCTTIAVFAATNEFNKTLPQYSNSIASNFTVPTNYTPDMINMAHMILAEIYREGYFYKRAGVMLANLVHKKDSQPGLFEDRDRAGKKDRLLEAVDKINKYGNDNVIRPSSYKLHNNWQMKRSFKSPGYTTDWLAIPSVKTD